MKAFLNSNRVKKKYLARVAKHADADEIIKGVYWENGKGCAVGCTVHSSSHKSYETELGIPEWLARVEDILFEGMPSKYAKSWPKVFLSTIPVGADLEQIKIPFILFILKYSLKSLKAYKFDKKSNPLVVYAQNRVQKAVEEVIRRHEQGLDLSAAESEERSAARSAESAAWSAAWSVESAEWSAAWGASYKKFADELLRLFKTLKGEKDK